MFGKDSLLGLGQIGIRDSIPGDLVDLSDNLLLSCLSLGGVGDGTDVHQSFLWCQSVKTAADLVDKSLLFADFGVQDGACTRCQDR